MAERWAGRRATNAVAISRAVAASYERRSFTFTPRAPAILDSVRSVGDFLQVNTFDIAPRATPLKSARRFADSRLSRASARIFVAS